MLVKPKRKDYQTKEENIFSIKQTIRLRREIPHLVVVVLEIFVLLLIRALVVEPLFYPPGGAGRRHGGGRHPVRGRAHPLHECRRCRGRGRERGRRRRGRLVGHVVPPAAATLMRPPMASGRKARKALNVVVIGFSVM